MFNRFLRASTKYNGARHLDFDTSKYKELYAKQKHFNRPLLNELTVIVAIFVIALGFLIDAIVYPEVQLEMGLARITAISLLLTLNYFNRRQAPGINAIKYTVSIFLTCLITAALSLGLAGDGTSPYFAVYILLAQCFILATSPKEAFAYVVLAEIGYIGTALLFSNIPLNSGEFLLCTLLIACGGIVSITSAFFRSNLMLHSYCVSQENLRLLEEQRERNEGLEKMNRALEEARDDAKNSNIELTEVNKEIDKARLEAEQAVLSKVEFLSGVTHRLITHVTSMEGYITLLDDQENDSSKQKEYLGSLVRSCRDLKLMSEEITDLSNLESNNYVAKIESFDIREVTTKLISDMDAEISAKGTYVDFILRGSIATYFKGDKKGISTVIRNLLSESLSQIQNGGVQITINFEETLQIDIVENGAKEYSEQPRESISVVLARKLVNYYNGEFEYVSEKGKTTTSVSIPAESISSKSPFQKQLISSCGVAIAEKSITVIDSRESFVKSIVSQLEFAGLEATSILIDETKPLPVFTTDILILRDALSDDLKVSEYERISGCEKVLSIESVDPQENSLFRGEIKPDRFALYALSEPNIFYDYLGAIAGEKPDNESTSELEKKREEGLKILEGASSPFKGLKILIVDDSLMNLSLGREMLSLLGIKVHTAESGKKAVQMCEEKKYDIILMDLMMPVLDGAETSKLIREHGKNTKTPFIGLTAKSGYEENEDYVALMDQIFTKPFSRNDVENAIAEMRATGKLMR